MPKKFVLVCHPRSGSTMLNTALSMHHNICMLGEVFNDETPAREHAVQGLKRLNPNFQHYRFGESGEGFLNKVFNEKYPKHIDCVGFKLFYSQARKGQSHSVWEFIKNYDSIRIIYLRREDYLKSYISLVYAKHTNKWVYFKEEPFPNKYHQVEIDIRKAESFIQSRVAEEDRILREFKNHKLLAITYEKNLIEDFVKTSQTIQDFLGIEHQSLEIITRKSTYPDHLSIVRNRKQVINHFKINVNENA